MRIRSVALHPGPVQPARPPGLGFSSVSAMIFPLQSFQEAWGLELSPGGGGEGMGPRRGGTLGGRAVLGKVWSQA